MLDHCFIDLSLDFFLLGDADQSVDYGRFHASQRFNCADSVIIGKAFFVALPISLCSFVAGIVITITFKYFEADIVRILSLVNSKANKRSGPC